MPTSPPARAVPRRCPLCGCPVPELLSPSGRRRRGRPRVYCSPRCRLGDRRLRAAPEPGRRREQVADFAAAVRAGIAARGLSLRELEAELVAAYPQLASSVATLSAWQTGASAPPLTPNGRDRVLALERCLRLPAGDLALLAPGGGAVPPARPPAHPADLAARRARLSHLLTTLAGPQQLLPVERSEEVSLGAGRRPVCTRITLRVRAAHDGVDRFWYVDSGDPLLRPAVAGTAGCRTGREVLEPAPPAGPALLAAELMLDRRLARGERHEFSFLVRYDPGSTWTRPAEPVFVRTVARPYERLDLTLSFDQPAVPAEVLACRWRHRDGVEVARRRVTVPGCATYQMVVSDPAPGGYGWRWAPAVGRSARVRQPGTSAA